MVINPNWGMNLKEYVAYLLSLGKGPSALEFQTLLAFYGRQKLNALIQEIKQEEKNETRDNRSTSERS